MKKDTIKEMLQSSHSEEVQVYEDMSLEDRKAYRLYVRRNGINRLSLPSRWLINRGVISFCDIGKKLGISTASAYAAYRSGIAKLKALGIGYFDK